MMVGCVIAARMGSSRCPGKILRELGGKPVLEHVVESVLRAALVDMVVVMRTQEPEDDAISALCERLGVECYTRPVTDDVLGGFYYTATTYGFDTVVRVTSDEPLTSSAVIDTCIKLYTTGCDYCSNMPNMGARTFPRGLDVEVFSYAVLKWMHENLTPERTPYGRYHSDYREHVTFYIRENPHQFTTKTMSLDINTIRLCVDTEEEYAKLERVFNLMGDDHSWWKAMHVLENHPELVSVEREGSQTPMKWRVW